MPGAESELELLRQEVIALRKVKKDYEEIVQQATEVIFKLDNSGHFTFVSAAFERVLGLTLDDVEGKHFTSIVHPEDLELCMKTFEVLEQFGKADNNIDFRVLCSDGGYKWVNCSAVCLFDAAGAPTHVIGMAHDVTLLHDLLDDLRNSGKALRISEERYRSLFDALGEGAMLIDESGTVIASNKNAVKILGMSNEEMLLLRVTEKKFACLYEDETPFPTHLHPAAITLGTGQPVQNVVMGMQLENEVRWISVNTEPIYYSDNRQKPDAVVASFVDITQARRDKAELLRNQQLLALETERNLQATRAVAEAVVDAQEKERADIGFELHDNVNQILSTARLFLDLAAVNEVERTDLIRRSSERLTEAVNEIRKICESLVPATLSDLGLVASIEDLVESINVSRQLHAEFYHIGEIEFISEKRKLVLFRIIQEQVNNVLKHACASKLTIELVLEEKTASLAISDNGIGFDKEAVKSRKGVGLHNINNRARLFEGQVNLITSPGSGCKLNIIIPL